MKGSGREKKYPTITFRPDAELEEKISKGMKAMKSKNKSSFLKEALSLGLEVLEQANWDIKSDYVRRNVRGVLLPMHDPPEDKQAASK
jgi:hypothetical protein